MVSGEFVGDQEGFGYPNSPLALMETRKKMDCYEQGDSKAAADCTQTGRLRRNLGTKATVSKQSQNHKRD